MASCDIVCQGEDMSGIFVNAKFGKTCLDKTVLAGTNTLFWHVYYVNGSITLLAVLNKRWSFAGGRLSDYVCITPNKSDVANK